jgi:flagellar biosynthesis GTPase FlhF
MHLRFLLLLFLIFSSIASASAQGIRGRITNEKGEAVPFATIYIPKLSTGTASNIDGHYELKLPDGNWEILFQYLGYHTQTMVLTIGKTFQEINVQLITQEYRIPEIKVLASGEDPAYYIMRRAIAMAPYYQKQVSKYSCKVYLKGSGVFEKIPFLLEKQMKKGGVKENQPFVMETVSQIDFELPDKVNQKVLAMRSSGQQNNTSPMGMITNNLYDADKYGVVSPVGRSALKVYNFSLDGVFEDQGRTINKIKVTPKIKGNDVFSGYIYIADLFWNIHSADLTMHAAMIDAKVHQLYAEVNKNTWMPVSLDFDMDFSGLGLKVKYKYVASISEYKTTLNPALNHTFIEKRKNQQMQEQQLFDKIAEETKQVQEQRKEKSREQKRIADLMEKPELNNRETAKLSRLIEMETKRNSPPEPLEIKSNFQVSQKQVNNDSAYWRTLRPIPLTESEKISFAKKDSFLIVSSTPEYKDSVRDSRRKFKLKHLLFGKNYNYSIDSIRKYENFSIPNLTDPTSLSFNSVDGLRLELPFSYSKSDSTGHSLRLQPHLAYAFARKKLDASFLYSQRLDGMTNSWITLSLGTTTEDFNRVSGLSRMTNDLYTLWREENFKRFYRRDFLQLMASRDLANGLNLNATIEYSDNSQLRNHSTFTFIDRKNREILPNIPENNASEDWQLENHQSFISRFVLEYTPRNRYRVRNHVKMYAGSKYPTFLLGYAGAFPGVAGSDSRFDLVKLGIRQKIDFGIDDHFSYQVNAGKFTNNSKLYFEDFQHFNTQATNFMFSSYDNSFRLLPFYQYSTGHQFAEAHAEWQSRRLILKQLPLIKNSSMSEKLFVNYLSTPEIKNYVETGYGISNLFLLLNVEAVAGFENGKFRSAGVKVSLNLK